MMPPMGLAVRQPALRLPWRSILLGIGLGLILALVGETARVLAGDNLHTVVPGRVYRCAQLRGPALERLVARLGIRTVINLRGEAAPQTWYMEEARATHHLGICQEDFSFSSGRLPSAVELRRLVEVLDHAEYPLLIHCQRGADRTGMASAVARLLCAGVDFSEGRKELGLRCGHIALGRPANLDRFFDLYAEWLAQNRLQHKPDALRRWISTEYTAGPCMAALELVKAPGPILAGKPFVFVVRATNIAREPWHLRADANAGIHLSYSVSDPEERCYVLDRAGLFAEEVPPGGAIELTLAIPALPRPGRYRLAADMIDEQQCNFHMTGSEPLEMEFDVAEQEAPIVGQRGDPGVPGVSNRLAPSR